MYGLYGLKHHTVEISGDVTDAGRTNERGTTNDEQGKIGLLSLWMLEDWVSQIHKGKSHKEASLPEKLRTYSSQPSLNVSPLRDQDRLESCPNCEKEMSRTHLCQDLDSTLDDGYQDGDKTEAVEGNCNCDCPLPICCTCLHDVQCSCYKDNPDSTTCSCDAHWFKTNWCTRKRISIDHDAPSSLDFM